MKYVLDSSVAFKWVVPEIFSDQAIHLRDELRDGRHEFLAPDVFPIELGHALTRVANYRRRWFCAVDRINGGLSDAHFFGFAHADRISALIAEQGFRL